MVELDFSIDLCKYRIRRNIKGDRSIKVDSHLLAIDDKGNETGEIEAASKKGEELKKIEELLGSTKDYVKNMNFIQEESLYQFLNRPKYAIDNDLNAILQLDYLGTIDGFCKTAINKLEKEITALEKLNSEYDKYLNENKKELENLENKLKANTDKEQQLTDLISQIEKRVKEYAELERLESQNKDLKAQLEINKEQIDNIKETLEEIQTKLNDISQKETERIELKKKVDMFENNENQLKQLQKKKEDVQEKLIKAEQELTLFKERQTQLKTLQQKDQELSNKLKSSATIEKKFKIVQKKFQEYSDSQTQISDIEKKIEENRKILNNIKKGECPLSHEKCPVAESLIDDRQKEIATLIEQKKILDDTVKATSNPEKEYIDLQKQVESFKDDKKDSNKVSEQLVELEAKVQGLADVNKSKEALEIEKKELESKKKRVQDANEKLRNDYDEYLRLEERIKDKDTLLKQIEKKAIELKKTKDALAIVETNYTTKVQEIEAFKKSKKFGDLSEIAKEKVKKQTLEKELQDVKSDSKLTEKSTDQLKKRLNQLLSPWASQAELQTETETTVHKMYKLTFFKDTLSATLTNLRERTLKEIKEQCNQMWAKFKSHSGMDTISWDDNFLPFVSVGGYDRSIYQLSASEKIMVYFSIRAALLAKLGPNFFIVADNLLGPFMKENQKVVLDLLRNIVDNTNIRQLIFTGFDVDPKFSCENRICL